MGPAQEVQGGLRQPKAPGGRLNLCGEAWMKRPSPGGAHTPVPSSVLAERAPCSSRRARPARDPRTPPSPRFRCC